MLILLTAWFVHNWWKLLIGLVAVIVILEGSHRKKLKDAQEGHQEDPQDTQQEDQQDDQQKEQIADYNEEFGD